MTAGRELRGGLLEAGLREVFLLFVGRIGLRFGGWWRGLFLFRFGVCWIHCPLLGGGGLTTSR